MDFLNPYVFVIGVSAVIILSYVFSGIARRTNIPSVLLLVALGVGVAELLDEVQIETGTGLFKILEVVGMVGLIMIVLEAALDLKLTHEAKPLIVRAILVALGGLLMTSAAVAYLLHVVVGLDLYTGLVYSIPISVLSSAVVIPSVKQLVPSKKEFLTYESTISDVLGILFFNIVVANKDGGSVLGISLSVVLNLVASTALALVISYSLVYLLRRGENQVKLFVLIALLVLLYAAGKMLHLSSLVIILVFGLVINNEEVFIRGTMRRWLKNGVSLQRVVENFHVVTQETAFVVRTLFFVIFGMTLNLASLLNIKVALLSVAILAMIYVLRWSTLRGAGLQSIVPELYVAPRGLITVLLFFAIPPAIATVAFDPGIILFVILATGFVMTFGLIAYGKEGAHVGKLTFDDWDALDKEIADLRRKRKERERELTD